MVSEKAEMKTLKAKRAGRVKRMGFGVMVGVCLLGMSEIGVADTADEDAPAKIDISSFPAQVMEEVIVPVPSEIFGILDKLGSPRWGQMMRKDILKPSQDRVETALLLGTVIAEGFIAVEAEDREQVKEIGRSVLNLAGAIGVRDSVIARSNAIIDAADKQDWQLVRKELDGALNDVRNAMIELRDEQLAQLVSLGGWLRGTEALTDVVNHDFSADAAELLKQPSLLQYFVDKIEGMTPRLKENVLVLEIHQSLGEIKPLINVEDGRNISEDSVKRIFELTNSLVEKISSTGMKNA